MKQILRAALLLAEIIASVWAVDLAFSLINDPSTILLIGWHMAACSWLERFGITAFRWPNAAGMKRRLEEPMSIKTAKFRPLGKWSILLAISAASLEHRLRDAHRPGKRGDQS